MKKILVVFIFLFSTLLSSQNNNNNKLIVDWIKIWGFLKYNHPNVNKNSVDWDREFLNGLYKFEDLDTKSVDDIYLELLSVLGEPKLNQRNKLVKISSEPSNINFESFFSSLNINSKLRDKLKYIRENRESETYKFVRFYKGEGVPIFKTDRSSLIANSSIESMPEMRLLDLAKLWNALFYFYPYRNNMEISFEQLLEKYVPIFIQNDNVDSHQLSIHQILLHLKDGNSFVVSSNIKKKRGEYRPAFSVSNIENNWVVSHIDNAELALESKINLGDIILKIDNVDVSNVVLEKEKLIPYSNVYNRNYLLGSILLNTKQNNIIYYIKRGNEFLEIPVKTYRESDFVSDDYYEIDLPWKKLTEDIGYLNAAFVNNNDLINLETEFENIRNLILDLRSPVVGTGMKLAKYLSIKNKIYAHQIKPNNKALGTYTIEKITHRISIGKGMYTRKIYVLIDEKTKNLSELLSVLLLNNDRVTFVGSNTYGAVGHSSKLQLLGDTTVYFTTIGYKNKTGEELQNIGIKPNEIVVPTIKAVSEGVDLVLEKTIEYINSKKIFNKK